jgi:ligand-binding sensor domain-containing protein
MSDLEQRLRGALQRSAADVRPHSEAEDEFARRLADRRHPRSRWQPLLMASAAAAAVIAIVLGALAVSSTPGSHSGTVARPTPPAGLVQLSVRLQLTPSYLSVGSGAAWLADDDGRLQRFDLLTGKLTEARTLPDWTTGSMAAGLGALWVADVGDHAVLRIDAVTGHIVSLPVSATGVLSVGASRVWAQVARDRLAALNLSSGRVDTSVPVPPSPDAALEDAGALWVAANHRLYRLSPVDGHVLSSVSMPEAATSIAATQGAVWVATRDQLLRFDTSGKQQRAIPIAGLRSISADHVGTAVYGVDDHGSVIAESESGNRVAMRITAGRLTGPVDASAAVWVVAGRQLWRLKEFAR